MPCGPIGLVLTPYYALWRFDENVPVCPLGRYWAPQADAIEGQKRTNEPSGMLVVHGEQNWDVVLAGE
jgi:hypothetical protein